MLLRAMLCQTSSDRPASTPRGSCSGSSLLSTFASVQSKKLDIEWLPPSTLGHSGSVGVCGDRGDRLCVNLIAGARTLDQPAAANASCAALARRRRSISPAAAVACSSPPATCTVGVASLMPFSSNAFLIIT